VCFTFKDFQPHTPELQQVLDDRYGVDLRNTALGPNEAEAAKQLSGSRIDPGYDWKSVETDMPP
jgi:hypothetical protein